MKRKNILYKFISALVVATMTVCTLFATPISAYSDEKGGTNPKLQGKSQSTYTLEYGKLTDNESLIYDYVDCLNSGDWNE